MAFERPTLSELIDRIQQDFVSRLGLAGSLLRRSMAYVHARVVAGAAHMLHGHLDFQARQMFADTAEAEYLRRIGSLFGVEILPATFATGPVVATGTNGTIISEGTILTREDGLQYTVDADATISGGEADLDVTASLAGEDYNSDSGTALTFESPISGLDSIALVDTDGLTGGADEESDDDYRVRVLQRMRNAPNGGSEADYVAWALAALTGVTRVWVYPLELGAGTVVVRFVMDGETSPIPSGGNVTTVQDYIDERRPVTADVTVVAPTANTVNFTFASITPDTTATREAVEAELADLFTRETEPGSTLYLSQIRTAIGSAEGVTTYTLTSPAADVTNTTNQIPVMGSVTWP